MSKSLQKSRYHKKNPLTSLAVKGMEICLLGVISTGNRLLGESVLYVWKFVLLNYWNYFLWAKDKKLYQISHADARILLCLNDSRTICPDTIRNKCLGNDVITKEFSVFVNVTLSKLFGQETMVITQKYWSFFPCMKSLKINQTCG